MDLQKAQELAKKEVALLNSGNTKLHSLILAKMKQFNTNTDQVLHNQSPERSTTSQPPVKKSKVIPRSESKSPEKSIDTHKEVKPPHASKQAKAALPIEKPKSKEDRPPSLSDIKQFIQNQRLKAKVEKERHEDKLDSIEKPLLFGKSSPATKRKEKKEFEVPAPVRGTVSRSGLVSREKNYRTEFEIMRDESDSRLMNAIRKQRLKELNEVRRLRSELEKKSVARKSIYSASIKSKPELRTKEVVKSAKISSPPKSVNKPTFTKQKVGSSVKKAPESPIGHKLSSNKINQLGKSQAGTDSLSKSNISLQSVKSSSSKILNPESKTTKTRSETKDASPSHSPEITKSDNREIINLILSQINSKLDPMLQSVQEHYIKTSNMIDQKLAKHILQAKEDETFTIAKGTFNQESQSDDRKSGLKPVSVASKNIFGLYNDSKVESKQESLELTEYDLLCIPSPHPKRQPDYDQIIIESIEDSYPSIARDVQQINEMKPKSAFDLHGPKEIVIESHVEFQSKKSTKTEGTSTETDKERTVKTIVLPTYTVEKIISDKEKRSKWLSVYFDYSELQPPWDAIESISQDIIKDLVLKISIEIEQFSNQYIDGLLEQELTII
ncbi:hypothetical protein HDV06_002575 [Boothiomyces sp. JEL0866]|nr:hypothetical protein HDV06_002575 [Boothiomyces sp. JEL0866]